jgi:hypothetical protein
MNSDRGLLLCISAVCAAAWADNQRRSGIITLDNFTKYAEMHKLMQARTFAEAQVLKIELGFYKYLGMDLDIWIFQESVLAVVGEAIFLV